MTDFLRLIERPCPEPVGVRIELVAMPDDPYPLPVGSRGTVVGGNGGQVWVAWDCGASLALAVGVDLWRRVGPTV